MAACAVTIVTFNSARYIESCLQALFATEADLDIVVIDNASCDETIKRLQPFLSRIRLVANNVNRGFAAGQNQAIAMTAAPWVLVLNPDVRVTPEFIPRLLEAGSGDQQVGTVCGKLRGADGRLLDSTGIVFTGELRHFDRGSKKLDCGQYDRREEVFGATGAAALYRRIMIADLSIDGEFFDEDFFAYREDADLAWRAQLFGWRTLYVPEAEAFHVRAVLPSNRRQVSAAINYHSVKNRFLMRMKNIDYPLYRKHFVRITARDVIVVLGCLLREWSSLPAFVYLLRNWRKTWHKRRKIQSGRRVPPSALERWF